MRHGAGKHQKHDQSPVSGAKRCCVLRESIGLAHWDPVLFSTPLRGPEPVTRFYYLSPLSVQ